MIYNTLTSTTATKSLIPGQPFSAIALKKIHQLTDIYREDGYAITVAKFIIGLTLKVTSVAFAALESFVRAVILIPTLPLKLLAPKTFLDLTNQTTSALRSTFFAAKALIQVYAVETATHIHESYSRDKNSRLDKLSSFIQKHPMATIAVATSVVAIISLYYCHSTTAKLPDSVHLEKATTSSSSKKRLFPLLDHTCQALPSVIPTAVSNLSLNEKLGNSTQYIAIKPVSATLLGDLTHKLKTHIPVELPLKVTQDIVLQTLPTCPLIGNNSLRTDEFKNRPKDTSKFTSVAKQDDSIQADYSTLFHGYSIWALGGLTTLAIYYLYERLQAKTHHLFLSNKKILQPSTSSSSINPSLQRRMKNLIMSPDPRSSSLSKHLGLELPTHRPYSDNKDCKATDLQKSSKARTLSESAKKCIYRTYRENLCNNATEYDHTLAIWKAIRAYEKKNQSDPHLTRDQVETIIKETDLKHRKAEYRRIRRNLGDAGVVSKVEEAKILEKYEQIPNKFHELLAWYNKGKSMTQQITLPQLIKILQLRYPYLGTTFLLNDKA